MTRKPSSAHSSSSASPCPSAIPSPFSGPPSPATTPSKAHGESQSQKNSDTHRWRRSGSKLSREVPGAAYGRDIRRRQAAAERIPRELGWAEPSSTARESAPSSEKLERDLSRHEVIYLVLYVRRLERLSLRTRVTGRRTMVRSVGEKATRGDRSMTAAGQRDIERGFVLPACPRSVNMKHMTTNVRQKVETMRRRCACWRRERGDAKVVRRSPEKQAPSEPRFRGRVSGSCMHGALHELIFLSCHTHAELSRRLLGSCAATVGTPRDECGDDGDHRSLPRGGWG